MGEAPMTDDVAATQVDVQRLYAEHWHSLVRLAYLLTDSTGAAEDLVQDAFVSLFRGSARIRQPDAALAYLRQTIVNRARSTVRRAVVARRHLPALVRETEAPAADSGALYRAESDRIVRALSELSVGQREVLVLRYWYQLSEAEIARTLGVSAGTVKSSASRGMAALKKLMDGTR